MFLPPHTSFMIRALGIACPVFKSRHFARRHSVGVSFCGFVPSCVSSLIVSISYPHCLGSILHVRRSKEPILAINSDGSGGFTTYASAPSSNVSAAFSSSPITTIGTRDDRLTLRNGFPLFPLSVRDKRAVYPCDSPGSLFCQ